MYRPVSVGAAAVHRFPRVCGEDEGDVQELGQLTRPTRSDWLPLALTGVIAPFHCTRQGNVAGSNPSGRNTSGRVLELKEAKTIMAFTPVRSPSKKH